MLRPHDRPLTDDDRALLSHINHFGSDGYPVKKLGRGWHYEFRTISSPVIYKTKRDAIAALETYLGVLRDCLGNEAYRRAIAEQAARGAE